MSARVELLGGFRLLVAGQERRLASRKARLLLARLALARGRPVSRETLCALFWESSPDEQGRVNLRQTLKLLRRALIPFEAALGSLDDSLSLDTHRVSVDALELEVAAEHADFAGVDLLKGDLLQGFSSTEPGVEEWLAVERAHIRTVSLRLLDGGAEAALAANDATKAMALTSQALAIDPLREQLHRRMMQLYAITGEGARAIRQFQLCRDLLRRELGVEPEPETLALYTTIRARRIAAIDRASAAGPPLPNGADPPTIQRVLDAPSMRQSIRYCRTADDVTLAYAVSGRGPPLVKAANWMSHLEYEWESPVWRHWIEGLSAGHTLVRYDQRGNGLSDWEVGDLSFEAMVTDLETVVDAAGLERFVLVGVSQGCAISVAYACRYPERIAGLVLYGGYVRGWRARGDPHEIAKRSAMATLISEGWGQDVPAFRQVFTSLFIPGANHDQMDWFNELQRISVSPENAVRLTEVFGSIDVAQCLGDIRAPTLVLHARGDLVCPIAGGRAFAAGIPGARMVTLESANHILLSGEKAFADFLAEVETFCGAVSTPTAFPNAGRLRDARRQAVRLTPRRAAAVRRRKSR